MDEYEYEDKENITRKSQGQENIGGKKKKKKRMRVFSVLSSVGGSGVGTVCISLFVSLVNYS